MRVVGCITARIASVRLPGKVMKDIEGKPLLAHLIERLKSLRCIDSLWLATSTNPENGVLIDVAKSYGIDYHCGSEDNVLERYVMIKRETGVDHLIRVTADNLLVDLTTIERMVAHQVATGAHYTAITGITLATGILSEVVSAYALERSYELGEPRHHSDAMTIFIKENPELFRIELLELPPHLYRPQYRLTVDTSEDLELIRAIFKRLYAPGGIVQTADVIKLLDAEPEIASINGSIRQKSINTYWEELDANIISFNAKRRGDLVWKNGLKAKKY